MRDTCQRKRIQMKMRKYQRTSKNWKTGTLTSVCHQPASDRLANPGFSAAAHVLRHGNVLARGDADPVDKNDEQHLGGQRIPQTHRRSDQRVEARQVGLANQVAGVELHQSPPHANVDDELRDDEERQCEKKPGVDFKVEQKGDLRGAPPRSPLQHREQQQRQPRDQHRDENASMDHVMASSVRCDRRSWDNGPPSTSEKSADSSASGPAIRGGSKTVLLTIRHASVHPRGSRDDSVRT